jgi:acetyl esterase
MPLDPRARRFLDRLAAMNPPSALSLSPQERRGALANLMGFSGPTVAVGGIENLTVARAAGPLTVRAYSPAGSNPGQVLPGLLYFHGGGLVAGSLDTHDPICRSLCNASGYRIFSVDYRLAPEHPFPAAVEDGIAAAGWLAANARDLGVDPERIGISGDSAGATLAAVVCQQAHGTSARFACQFLLCPITDFAAESESRRSFAQGYLVDSDTLLHDLKYYLESGTDAADPRISPLRAPAVAHLPPTAVHTAEFDPLRDEGQAYAERLREAGVRTIYRCHPGMIHLFYGMGGLLAYASTAYGLMGADLRNLLAPDVSCKGDTG